MDTDCGAVFTQRRTLVRIQGHSALNYSVPIGYQPPWCRGSPVAMSARFVSQLPSSCGHLDSQDSRHYNSDGHIGILKSLKMCVGQIGEGKQGFP